MDVISNTTKQIWILSIVLALSAGIAGGYFYSKKNLSCAPCPKSNTNDVVQTSKPLQTISPVPTQTPENLEWSKYEDEKNNFSFEYPLEGYKLNPNNNFIFGKSNNALAWLISDNLLNQMKTLYESNTATEGPLPDFQIIVYENLKKITDKYTDLEEYLNSNDFFSNVSDTLLDGKQAFSVNVSTMTDYYRIYVKYNEKIYILEFGQASTKDNLNSVEKQILESFKFTN